ncbi:MAG: VanZ family protein [Eubacteriales bacterium]|nr:VanZ family protein [Eubacteriales bacterium]
MKRGKEIIRELLPEPRKRGLFYLYSSLALAVIIMAWMFSALPPGVSRAQSGWLTALARRLLGTEVSELLLRKLAHFTEYLLLGVLMGLAIKQLGWRKRLALAALALALPVAVIDETIQFFSGRGPSIVDVWIDMAGAAAGLMVSWAFLGRRPKKRGAAT